MLMIKILLATSLLIVVAYIGYLYSRKYVQRVLELFDLISAFQMFETKVRYESEPVGEAFEYISNVMKTGVSKIFSDTIQYLKTNDSLLASQAWDYSVRDNIPNLSLNEQEGQILISFGNNFGNSDIEGQIKNINLTIKQLENQVRIAQEDSTKNSKLYRSLGLLGGMALFILLI